MSKQPETLLKEKVLAGLRSLPRCYVEKIQQKSVNGTPDIFACVNGWFVAIELKVDDDVAEPLQEYVLFKVRKAGGIGLVVWKGNWPDVLRDLRTLAEGGGRCALLG